MSWRSVPSGSRTAQKQDRVPAHILVCFLAYVLWKTLGQWMRRSGLGDTPRTVLEESAKINSGDVVLPTQSLHGHGLSFVQWLLIFGLGLLLGGAAGGYLAWRGFRRRFVGIERTPEELREDGVWLHQWLPSGQDTEGPEDAA
jgi:hypothetical protein